MTDRYIYMYRDKPLNFELADAWQVSGSPPCVSESELFDSEIISKMREAAAICNAQCDQVKACRQAAHDQGEEACVWGGELPMDRMKEVKLREGLKV